MVFIRTDANENVATGHLMRCITIAKKIKQLGETVVFVFRDNESVDILNGRENYILLQACKTDRDSEIQQMIQILCGEKNAKLLLDLYEFDATYMEKLKPYARIITFDDMFQEKFPADMIINYNLYYTEFDYASRYNENATKLLLGGKYVPIREEFLIEKPLLKQKVSTVMLICGGGDKYHVLVNLVKMICKEGLQDRYRFVVVAGILNRDIAELNDLSKTEKNIIVYENVKEMSEIMKDVDVVVSAASTVLYECCCMAKPTIFFSVADNQSYDAECFAKNGMMQYVGDVRIDFAGVLKAIIVNLENIAREYEVRKDMVRKMESVVDGKGAERIAENIVMMETKKVGLITVHDWHNYGSMLQTYAMCKYIDSLENVSCEVIDFIAEKFDASRAYALYDSKVLDDSKYQNYALDVEKRRKCFEEFYDAYKKSSERYHSDEEIEANPPRYDVYVSGSDQIWNVNFRIASRAFFLGFTDSENKLAFSTSVGRCMERKLVKYADLMKKYKKIFIREETGAERIRNVTERTDVDSMIDPTFLYSKEEWLKLLPTDRVVAEKYIICYATIESQLEDMMPILNKIREKYKFQVVLFGMVLPRNEEWIINKVDVGPYEFLRLYRDAEFVLTHSFHGTAFSINFNKEFLVFNDKTHNFRKTDLLKRFGLTNRVVHKVEDVESALESFLNYEEVNVVLDDLRKKAQSDIERWIGECQ